MSPFGDPPVHRCEFVYPRPINIYTTDSPGVEIGAPREGEYDIECDTVDGHKLLVFELDRWDYALIGKPPYTYIVYRRDA